ncbi:MAG: hypothetical protein WBD36_14695 [Bacteroidota bacterium]
MGQTMITVAFLVLLTYLVLSANRLLLDSESSSLSSQAEQTSVDLVDALLAEVGRKKYDQKVSSGDTVKPTFTAPASLGPETGESFTVPESAPFQSGTKYNDVDDYNGYSRIVDATQIKGFILRVRVYYVQDARHTTTPYTGSPYPDFKRIDVSVEHPLYMPSATTYSRIFTY